MNDTDFAASNIDIFTTHTTVRPDVSLDELVAFLSLRKATGEICVTLNQGGVRSVKLIEHTKLKDAERDNVRRILKI